MSETPYRTIKRCITEGIAGGQWTAGATLPSENALCRRFHVSRMTVNRAMRELAAERVVRRVPGVGTFVAEPAIRSGLVRIRNIAAEITDRGHSHRAEMRSLAAVMPPRDVARAFGLRTGTPIFHSVILHFEDAAPLQLEDRYVNPVAAPDYLAQDLTIVTPNEYLSRVAPLREATHVVQAMAATPELAAALAIAEGAACLVVSRRTWSHDLLVSMARLTHPGDRFSLSGRFAPGADGLWEGADDD